MNIIIVSKALKKPKTLQLQSQKSLILLGLIIFSGFFTTLYIGAVLGKHIFGEREAQQQLQLAQAQLKQQQSELTSVRSQMQQDMNALSIRLGQLQAQATRLNALGERLAKVGQLDDGEFDFSSVPALGGVENETLQVPAFDITHTLSEIDYLELTFQNQAEQLGLLDSLLRGREIDASLLPMGLPVKKGYRSSGYGYRTDPINGQMEFHTGVDFNGKRGTEILAVAAGVVSFVGKKAGYGNVVEINHGNGYMTRYAHNDKNLVQEGDTVRANQAIAAMGSTGRATGVHVHFEVWQNGRITNPSQYLQAMR